jgi:uncharacterized membrane protein YqaE (UPF0057 family)|tara:strand:+ start:3950 stop:4279 length:330 start_codon:yes stop_codon:yes gene_type:complete
MPGHSFQAMTVLCHAVVSKPLAFNAWEYAQLYGLKNKNLYGERLMRYLLAILLPPVAVFLCGKPIQGIINIILTLCFFVPGVIHAIFVVHSHLADKRTDRIVDALDREG